MTLAAIIAKHQKAGTAHVLGTWEQHGNAQAVGAQHVPAVPTVPTVPGEKTTFRTNPAKVFDPMRAHLQALVDRQGLDAALVDRLHNLDVAACADWGDSQLVTYLELLSDTATRWAGKVPEGHAAAILCHHCGPVWVHPGMAVVLPVVDGWPHALGCPWCAIRKAGEYIPSPPVQCMGCQRYCPDKTGPGAGIGRCASDKGMRYPMQRHACEAFKPSGIVGAPKKEPSP